MEAACGLGIKPRLSRMVDGDSVGAEDEKIDAGVKAEVGGERDKGWIRSQPGTPSSTLGPMRIGGYRIFPLSRTRRNANSGRTSKLGYQLMVNCLCRGPPKLIDLEGDPLDMRWKDHWFPLHIPLNLLDKPNLPA